MEDREQIGVSQAPPLVLLVDDLPQNLVFLGSVLKKEGYEISLATSGAQALEMLDVLQPDLILLDIVMPDMDGLEVCRRLKEAPRWRDIPIIFITAKITSEDVVEGFKLGAVDYITKPFNSTELLARVHTHCELKRIRDYHTQLIDDLHEALERRKKAESAVGAANDRFTRLLDAMEDSVYVVTDDYHVIYANQKTVNRLGRDFTQQKCYSYFRGRETPCPECHRETFDIEQPVFWEYYNENEEFWYSGNELAIDMPGIEQPTKLVVARNITFQKKAEEKIRALSHRLFKIQEEERHFLSRELHDDVGQQLSAIQIGLSLLVDELSLEEDQKDRAVHLSESLKHSIHSVRELAIGLRPSTLQSLGLVKTVQSLIDRVANAAGMKIDFFPAGMDKRTFDDVISINIYRTIQESLNNIIKHSGASAASVALECDGKNLHVRIRDNGSGFNPEKVRYSEKSKLGLLGIKERIELLEGHLAIQSESGTGTEIDVFVPLFDSEVRSEG